MSGFNHGVWQRQKQQPQQPDQEPAAEAQQQPSAPHQGGELTFDPALNPGVGGGPQQSATSDDTAHIKKLEGFMANRRAQGAAPVRPGPAAQGNNEATEMWAGMMADYDASLGGRLNQTYADEAAAARKADVINAMSGRGVTGGGHDAATAQVALGGMAQRQDVMNEHAKQGLVMKLTRLEQLIKQAEASKDRDLRERLQAEADKTLLALQGSGIDTTNYGGPAHEGQGYMNSDGEWVPMRPGSTVTTASNWW